MANVLKVYDKVNKKYLETAVGGGGSVDAYFGPEAPSDPASNPIWVKTETPVSILTEYVVLTSQLSGRYASELRNPTTADMTEAEFNALFDTVYAQEDNMLLITDDRLGTGSDSSGSSDGLTEMGTLPGGRQSGVSVRAVDDGTNPKYMYWSTDSGSGGSSLSCNIVCLDGVVYLSRKFIFLA